jgi:predicted nuclease of predicted toxin-antitoxin system
VIRYHLDQHVSSRIAKALRRRQIDVTTTAEAGLQDADDVDHVRFALAESRVIVTNDPDFLARDQAGTQHPGICYWEQQNYASALVDANIAPAASGAQRRLRDS